MERGRHLLNIIHVWPEVYKLANKLKHSESITRLDELCLNELIDVTGWDRDDIIRELICLDEEPRRLAKWYRTLIEKYFNEAIEQRKKGSTRRAAHKLWASITALMKYLVAEQNMYLMHWDLGELYEFTTSYPKYKNQLSELLDRGLVLFMHYHGNILDRNEFEYRWKIIMDIIHNII